MQQTSDILRGLPEIADYLGLGSRQAAARAIAAGLPAKRVGRLWLSSPAAIQRWLASERADERRRGWEVLRRSA